MKSSCPTALPLAAACALLACAQNAPTSAYTPITGVQLPAPVIVQGHGCGMGDDQVYKYAALVGCQTVDGGGLAATCPGSDAGAVAAGVSDCFSDYLFSNLPSTTSQSFFFSIYGFNSRTFQALDGGLECPATAPPPCPAQDPAHVEAASAYATWTTACKAMQVAGATVVASCAPLRPAAGLGPDAGPDGGPDAAGDAGNCCSDASAGCCGDAAPE
ncbi:MAG: hypothetical protein JOZ69_15715 [Myxococcales bacterium]|nr:hypothetical protein [Myxococcales bacterium]